jgi:hypothetical protein
MIGIIQNENQREMENVNGASVKIFSFNELNVAVI